METSQNRERHALEALLGIRLPDNFEAHIELHSPELSQTAKGKIVGSAGEISFQLSEFENIRFNSVACW